MKDVYASVKAIGIDAHYKFTTVTMRDAAGKIVRRERLDHRDRAGLREALRRARQREGWTCQQLSSRRICCLCVAQAGP